MTMLETRSIHHRRRWYYLLWSGLLAASLGALALWLIPGQHGEGRLGINILLKEAPEGTVAQLWSGRAAAWNPGAPPYGIEVKPGQDGWLKFPTQGEPSGGSIHGSGRNSEICLDEPQSRSQRRVHPGRQDSELSDPSQVEGHLRFR
jgi:hypothetical protein